MCATNHALDAFLEGVLEFESSIVRVGGRSSCEALADKNLRERYHEANPMKIIFPTGE